MIEKFKRFVIFILMIVLLDQSIGILLRYFYFNQKTGADYELNYCIEKVKSEGLILGSSRALHHYDCNILSEKFNFNFYNAGRGGSSLLFSYAQFKIITNRYTPKVVILDINVGDLMYCRENYDRLAVLNPYYENNPEICKIIQLKTPFENLKMLSKTYSYNSMLGNILTGNIFNSTKNSFDGFRPLKGNISDTIIKEYKQVYFDIDINILNALKDMAMICKTKNIAFIVVQSPIFLKNIKGKEFEEINNIVKLYGGTFLSYIANDTFLSNPKYFRDNSHLNEIGANIFSNNLANNIIHNQ